MNNQYTNQKNNAEHQNLANKMIMLMQDFGKIDTAMVRDNVNGNVRTAFDRFEKGLKEFNNELENHTINSLELGKDEYSDKLKNLQKEVETLKKIKILAIISSLGLVLSILNQLNFISFG